MAYNMSSPPIVLRFSMWHFSAASEVMKLMNSETHSWTHSLASLAILAVEGTDCFMIRETLAIWRRLVSETGGKGGAYGEETVLFSVLSHLLFGDRCRRGCVGRGRLVRSVGVFVWLRRECGLDIRHGVEKKGLRMWW